MAKRTEHLLSVLIPCLVAASAQQAAAAPAAHVEFAVGNPQIVSAGGAARPLTKGAAVETGDTVSTNDGRVQLRFSDGGYVSLQPQSRFRVDDYRWEGRVDGSERGFFSLLQGGLRTITGLVGRSNKRNYQVSTTVATIGIRGTEYKISPLDGGIIGSVGDGAIEVCTGAGCFAFTNGESFQVSDPKSQPELTDKQVDLPPPSQGRGPGSVFGENNDPTKNPGGTPLIRGNEVDSSGTIAGLRMIGTRTGMTVADIADGRLRTRTSTVVFDDTGVPVQIGGSLLPPLTDVGNDGFIAWGRENSTAAFGYFLVTGPPTTLSDIDALAISNPVATYTLIGGTRPIGREASGAPVVGTLTGGSLTVHFAGGTVDASLQLDMAGKALNLGASGMRIVSSPIGATFTSNRETARSIGESTGLCAVAGGTCGMQGFFAGAGAARAGIVYEANTLAQGNKQPTGGITAAGAAALTLKR